MSKSIFAIILLLMTPALISESFSYFGGDMIDNDFVKSDLISSEYESEIIKFNQFQDEQQFKRYLIFGQGSSSEIGHVITNYSVSSPNGFFSIVTAPENTISIFQSKDFM